jgi:hypothetical protein
VPDVVDELRRYADAAERAVPDREVPTRNEAGGRRSVVILVGAVAAAVVAVAVWVGVPDDPRAAVDTAEDVSLEDRAWELERVGVIDGDMGGTPVWFASRWWAVSAVDGQVTASTDGSTWEEVQHPLPAGTVLPFGGLVANDEHLLLVGADDDGRVLAATTTDGSDWDTSVVGESGVPRGEMADVVSVAFDDRLGVAVRIPTTSVLETMLASRRLAELVDDFVNAESYSHYVDPQTETLHIESLEGDELFAGSPVELGLTEEELRLVVEGLTTTDTTDTHDWLLHLSDDGTTWHATDLPPEAREGAGMASAGRAMTVSNAQLADTWTTVDGRNWTPLDLSAASIGHGHTGGGAFHATASDALWILPQPGTGDPALRSQGLDQPFRPTAVTSGTTVARSGRTTAFLVDVTPPDPYEQEDLEAQWGWAHAQFTWSDGTFEFTGSYMGGGTFTDLRTGRSWPISYDDFVGAGTNTEVVEGEVRFIDPDNGDVLVAIGDEFKNAIAAQHPRWADVVHGATAPDPTPAPARRLRVALTGPEAAAPEYVDLPPLPPEVHGATLAPGPEDTFLVLAVTRIDGDANQFSVSEHTAFLVRRR